MTIDERLQFLLQSTESLDSNMHALTEATQANARAIAAHEKRWEMLRRGLAGALSAALDDSDNGEGEAA